MRPLRSSVVASRPVDSTDADLTDGRFVLRPATRVDLPAMSRAHIDLLPMGLFPALGPRFLQRWQRTFLESPHGVGIVAVDTTTRPGEVVGLVLGATDHHAHTAELARNRRALASLALAGCLALTVRPRVAVRTARSRLRPLARRLLRIGVFPATAERAASVAAPNVAVMSVLAVRPQWRRSGIGVLLVAHFVEQARLAGATRVEAQTSTGSVGATGFYERLGWEAGAQESTPDGESVRTYHHRLEPPDRAIADGEMTGRSH
ncbi:GNAT family N-acetyltransferase [Solwaraspora sp. WMMD1047]|uniref:GNAT family N-acetyltransferase n=1 Tax=Solwaraspora sp. WMMD1047 TaxID=3016102 RepID=UPI0024161A09|nr:GNAT family N-acetyltransferase [Solwaraspora sp. WMMD1047]MDG4832337.1 GNAT family N-acetyltransferase [Solwaraspora sp. WMMD1047]